MKAFPWTRRLLLFAAASGLFCGSFHLTNQRSVASTLDALHAALPGRIEAWTVVPEDRSFDDQTIFDCIDGTGEVYRAYNTRSCLSRRYAAPGQPDMVLDIFDMGSSADAFGVFTHARDGEELRIGQGALYRPGWLSLWKDRFFVSIYGQEQTEAAERAVRGLGAKLADLIPSLGALPLIVSRLPAEGLVPRSVRYLHDPEVLNYHYYVSDENILPICPLSLKPARYVAL